MLVEHHMGVVMRACDRITVLDYGRKLVEGTPADIRTNAGVIEAYLGKKAVHAKSVRTAPAETGHAAN
jgi:ABC-type branched-subunit amino acid transport system ATPase component